MNICFTYVDKKTKIPAHVAQAKNGVGFPDVRGLTVDFADESNWPVTNPRGFPRFFGTCDQQSLVVDVNKTGIIAVLTDQEYEQCKQDELRARKPSVATTMQVRMALLQLGLLAQVEQFIQGLPEPQQTQVKIQWEYAQVINKNHATVQEFYAQAGISIQQLDEIFELAVAVQ